MVIHQLNGDECAALLSRASVGRLACAHDGQPYIVPMHFSFDAERRCLYGFSTVGQKVEWMRHNPKVCVEVDEIADRDHWTTVVVFGRYEEIHDSPADVEARQRAQTLFQRRREWWLPGAAKVENLQHHAMVVYRIQILRMTGRRAGPQGRNS
jgi:nitroimidazol reductase NimA-like FMN-containing flavoprotein (pyridoxamine 5'-phosphate oxidase superfamily)